MRVLEGKSAVVTGAGRGLGRAFAMGMAAAGSRLVVNDIDRAKAEEVAGEIRAAGGVAAASGDDVGDWQAAKRLVQQCAETFGSVDIVVNNAGITSAVPVWKEDEQTFDRIVHVNLKGTFAVTRHALDLMLPKRAGRIINISSGAQSGVPQRSIYAATKGGIASLTYTWAMELAEYGITVNALTPTAQTRLSPTQLAPGEEAPPDRRPENTAPLVVYLASDEAGWITGQVFRLSRKTLSLYSHPRPGHDTTADSAWTYDVLRSRLPTEFRPLLEPVGLGEAVYRY
jgi:NAD(P)-dependent dehydrogenase (short-subunit alcohol dehydrogenase family)